jgi:hypothetical protein
MINANQNIRNYQLPIKLGELRMHKIREFEDVNQIISDPKLSIQFFKGIENT